MRFAVSGMSRSDAHAVCSSSIAPLTITRSRRPDQAGLEAGVKEICATRVRYGYRRVHVLLRREGWDVNIKRTHGILQ